MTQKEQLELLIEFFKKNDHELSEAHYRSHPDKPVSIKLLKRMWGSGTAYLRARRRAVEAIEAAPVSKPAPAPKAEPKKAAPAAPKVTPKAKPAEKKPEPKKAAPKAAPKVKAEKGKKKA